MGAKKWTFEKRGAAHRFFFISANEVFLFFIGAAPIVRPVFFFEAPITYKNSMGKLPLYFLLFFHLTETWYANSASGIIFSGQNRNFWWCAHCAPIDVLFYRPSSKKIIGAERPSEHIGAHAFFFPPMILISIWFGLFFCGFFVAVQAYFVNVLCTNI